MEESCLEKDDQVHKLVLEGQTRPFLLSDSFGKPTPKHPNTFVWFLAKKYLLFAVFDFIRRISNLKNCYWLKTDDIFHSA